MRKKHLHCLLFCFNICFILKICLIWTNSLMTIQPTVQDWSKWRIDLGDTNNTTILSTFTNAAATTLRTTSTRPPELLRLQTEEKFNSIVTVGVLEFIQFFSAFSRQTAMGGWATNFLHTLRSWWDAVWMHCVVCSYRRPSLWVKGWVQYQGSTKPRQCTL